MPHKPTIAIIGSGPAGLMATHILASAGCHVVLFEKRKSPGRKLLIAGSSGLNITFDAPAGEFHKFYSKESTLWIKPVIEAFAPQDWIEFIHGLGIKTFKGTSRRYFVEQMKASTLLKTWTGKLESLGVEMKFGHECIGFEKTGDGKIKIGFSDKPSFTCDALCFCLGGASWEPDESPLRWTKIFLDHQIKLNSFTPSNVGYEIDWPEGLVAKDDRAPLKGVKLTTSKGSKTGDLMLTPYGIEGTPVYFVGTTGRAELDLKPDLTLDQIKRKLNLSKENRSPLRRAKKYLSLSPAGISLLAHFGSEDELKDLELFCKLVKSVPLDLKAPRPLEEAISSAGGIDLNEVDENLMLKKQPGVFIAGEMLDWDAPTGGFLIQACVSQGWVAGQGILKFLVKNKM
ncbi:MAG: TIGR03862 family flavoprotein [Bdellovibrionota bacterium]